MKLKMKLLIAVWICVHFYIISIAFSCEVSGLWEEKKVCSTIVFMWAFTLLYACACVCVYVCMYVHMFVYICVYVCVFICIYVHVFVYIYVYVYVFVYICVCMCVCVFICMFMYLCIYVCMCVFIYVCSCACVYMCVCVLRLLQEQYVQEENKPCHCLIFRIYFGTTQKLSMWKSSLFSILR